MEAIKIALKEEQKEAGKLIRKYEKELSQLPKGSFFLRKMGNNSYGYLTYSEKGQINQKYLGLLEEDEIKKYKELMNRKKKLKELLKKASHQKEFLQKALKHAR